MSQKIIGKVFDPFVQAETTFAKNYGGTGLGLAISRKLIHLMNGTITVESELKKGTTFNFTICLEKCCFTRGCFCCRKLGIENMKDNNLED